MQLVSAPFSQNDRLSVPFWLTPLIQTPLNRLCSIQHRGRAHATHQNRLIESRATPDDFAQNHSDLNRMFLPVTHRGGPKGLPESLDSPTFFHGGTHSGFQRDRRSYYLGEIYSLSKTGSLGEAWP